MQSMQLTVVQMTLTKTGRNSWTALIRASRLASSSTSSNGSCASVQKRYGSSTRCFTAPLYCPSELLTPAMHGEAQHPGAGVVHICMDTVAAVGGAECK